MLNADREEFYRINNVVSTINKFQGEQESEKRDLKRPKGHSNLLLTYCNI